MRAPTDTRTTNCMKNTTLLLLYFCTALLMLCDKANAQNNKASQRDALLAKVARSGQDTFQVNALNELADYYAFTFPDSTILFAERALSLSKAIDFKYGLGQSYLQLCVGNAFIGQRAKALELSRKAYEVFSKLGNSRKHCRCLPITSIGSGNLERPKNV